jgi:hypothetical protein
MREVPLHGVIAAGRVALVDDPDFELVMAYRWHVYEKVRPSGSVRGPYAMTTILNSSKRPSCIYMHALITGYRQTDHANGNGLDNRRQNLREATRSQNLGNQAKHRSYMGRPTQSRYKGVSRNGSGWAARIRVDRQYHYLGTHRTEEEAAHAYDRAAREAWGSFARCNFEDS